MSDEIQKAVTSYEGNVPLRSLMQLIPTIGGPLDSLLAWKGAQLREQRLNDFIEETTRTLAALDSAAVQYTDFESEEGADFLMLALQVAVKHRSKRRIAALADVIAKKVMNFGDWNEAEEALLAVDDLHDFELMLIHRSGEFKLTQGTFAGTSTFHVGDQVIHFGTRVVYENSEPKTLTTEFPDAEPLQLRLAVNRLQRLGYVRDEGVNRWSKEPGTHLGFTSQADWLRRWISNGRLTTYL